MKTITQVKPEHYSKNYDSVDRFISYFYQINSITQTLPKNILEIGVGNKTVSNYLKQANFKITTCDFDIKLNPDKVGDIRKLPFRNKSFSTVSAFEVLEHIPFSDFEKALKEMHRVSKKNVIISIPYNSAYFETVIKTSSPILNKQLKFAIRIPRFDRTINIKEHKEHYWELGTKNYSKKRIKTILNKYFIIKKEFHPLLNSYHYFYIMLKR